MTPHLGGKRFLVIGAGGFIGSHLCHHLVSQGGSVVAFGRLPRFAPHPEVTAWAGVDVKDRASLRDAVDRAEIVFHLLGSANPIASNRDPVESLREALEIDGSIVDLCAARRIERLVYVSSGGTVYGAARYLPIDEVHPTDPLSAYGLAKLCTEKLLHLRYQLSGLDHVILRVANPYGPRQDPRGHQGIVAKLLYRALRGETVELWGDGSATRDYVFISDVVTALILAATRSVDERIFNIGSGVGRSLIDVLTTAATLLDRPVERVHLPTAAAALPTNVLDCTRARDLLGWRPTVDWHDGLLSTIDWIGGQFGLVKATD
jgi:UDP-glucose 4-epimerase